MISILEKVNLGNLDQWILVRGNEDNPIILFLHGGPGLPMMPFHQHFQSELEEKYLVVHWDQRGTGKSFSDDIPKESMNFQQILSDAYDLIQLLKQRFKKEKIYLAGHSWGTILGIHLIDLFPEDFYSLISIGQVVSFSKSLEISHKFAIKKAKEQKCEDAVKELLEIGEPPFVEDIKLSVILRNVARFGGKMHTEISFPSIAKQCEEYTEADIKNIPKGLDFSDKYLWNEIIATNIMDKLLTFKVPIYFFCGRYDYLTPTDLIEEYCTKINAPFKRVIIFENSAHYPYVEEPKEFSEAIIKVLENSTLFGEEYS